MNQDLRGYLSEFQVHESKSSVDDTLYQIFRDPQDNTYYHVKLPVFLDFTKEVMAPGVNRQHPNGLVGLRVDDNFWIVAVLPYRFHSMDIRDIVATIWPEVYGDATFEADVEYEAPNPKSVTEKALVFKAPEHWEFFADEWPTLFLAGSIEMGAAEDWQAKVTADLSNEEAVILNPRRDNWDPNWEQSIDNLEFRTQVEWELNGIDKADVVLFYFSPGTKSPVTLLELGLRMASAKPMVVCCPEGFWRKGNIEVLCRKYQMEHSLFMDLDEAVMRVRRHLKFQGGRKAPALLVDKEDSDD